MWESDPRDWPGEFEAAHRQIADFFHISETFALLFTAGLHHVARIAVFDHFWNPGDRVLASGSSITRCIATGEACRSGC